MGFNHLLIILFFLIHCILISIYMINNNISAHLITHIFIIKNMHKT